MNHPPKILVADDELANLELMGSVLSDLGYKVLTARDGEEAVLNAISNLPDLILMDVVMPRVDGLDAIRQVKANPDLMMIPVVVVSGVNEVVCRVKALEAGADDFLNKPVDLTELQARIRSLLKVKEYHDHLLNYQKELEKEVSRRTIQLRKSLERIRSASLEAIYRLSLAAEYKNKETGDHIKRVSQYAGIIARNMGLNSATIDAIVYAAPMHDIGKIGIPDHILLKPGKHDSGEWEIMKQHTIIGAKILEGSGHGFIRLASVIALTHHEKWDGTGYPRGLKGGEIPISGRITALADYYDAMTSARLYRVDILKPEDAFRDIINNRGVHFDPKVVDCFLGSRGQIYQIMDDILAGAK